MSRVLKVGITDFTDCLPPAEAAAMAANDDTPHTDVPDVWFSSLPEMTRVLAGQNLAVLNVIRESRPQSLLQLAELTGRNIRTVTEILQNLARYGLVRLHRDANRMVRPEVDYDSVELVINLNGMNFTSRPAKGRHF